MKTEIRYCTECEKDTRHDIFKDEESIFPRLFFGICTLGLSEGLNSLNARCQYCGEIEQIDR